MFYYYYYYYYDYYYMTSVSHPLGPASSVQPMIPVLCADHNPCFSCVAHEPCFPCADHNPCFPCAAHDLAATANVQDAFVIAVEQQARERLERLSALKKIKPVDMTKLPHQVRQ